jgi:hypothetical protein
MTKTDAQAYKYEQIEKIVKNCEDFCEDRYESDYSKKSLIMTSYREIAEIVMGHKEEH